jgi:putative transposase
LARPDYRLARLPGGTCFFIVNLYERYGNGLLRRDLEAPSQAVRAIRRRHPFGIHAWVVMADHLHCVIELPASDADFAIHWRLIKMSFSKGLPRSERVSLVRARRGERGIAQRRFWEHLIRDEADLRSHVDYVHFNPVRQVLFERVRDWQSSTFGRLVLLGAYPADWVGGDAAAAAGAE